MDYGNNSRWMNIPSGAVYQPINMPTSPEGMWYYNEKSHGLFRRIGMIFTHKLPTHTVIRNVRIEKNRKIYFADYSIISMGEKNVYEVTEKVMDEYSYRIRKKTMEDEEYRRNPELAKEYMEQNGFRIRDARKMYMIIDPHIIKRLHERKNDEEYDDIRELFFQGVDSRAIIHRIFKHKDKTAQFICEKADAQNPINFGYAGSLTKRKGRLRIQYRSKDPRVRIINDEVLNRILLILGPKGRREYEEYIRNGEDNKMAKGER